MEKTIASVDSKGGGCVKSPLRFTSILLAIALAFSLCFYSPREAKAQFADAAALLGNVNFNLLSLVDTIKNIGSIDGLTSAKDALVSIKDSYDTLRTSVGLLKDNLTEIKDTLKTVNDINSLRAVVDQFDNALDIVVKINSALDKLEQIQEDWEEAQATLDAINDVIDNVKNSIDDFLTFTSALKNIVSITERIINFATSILSFIDAIQNFASGNFISNAASGQSNAIPNTEFITNPDINMADLEQLRTDLLFVYCSLTDYDIDSVCTVGSDAYCGFMNSTEQVCVVGSVDWCLFDPWNRLDSGYCNQDD